MKEEVIKKNLEFYGFNFIETDQDSNIYESKGENLTIRIHQKDSIWIVQIFDTDMMMVHQVFGTDPEVCVKSLIEELKPLLFKQVCKTLDILNECVRHINHHVNEDIVEYNTDYNIEKKQSLKNILSDKFNRSFKHIVRTAYKYGNRTSFSNSTTK